MLVDDTSTTWDEPGVPDDHLAIQYWRDPLVVSTTPAAGSTGPAPAAITVTFQRDIQPAGADYSDSVVVTGPAGTPAGTVTETGPGTLTWVPATGLAAGAYTATVSGVSSTGPAGVPIRRPYTFAFTVS
jgi:hypothetical protein